MSPPPQQSNFQVAKLFLRSQHLSMPHWSGATRIMHLLGWSYRVTCGFKKIFPKLFLDHLRCSNKLFKAILSNLGPTRGHANPKKAVKWAILGLTGQHRRSAGNAHGGVIGEGCGRSAGGKQTGGQKHTVWLFSVADYIYKQWGIMYLQEGSVAEW